MDSGTDDKVRLIPKTGGGFEVVAAGASQTPPSRDDLPVFDSKGNILNEYARNSKQFGYDNELKHKRSTKKALQLVHTKQRFQYKGKTIVNDVDAIGQHLKNSNTYKIKLLEQSSNKLLQFINRLVQLGLEQIDIDPNGAATIVYIKQPQDTKQVRTWDYFLDNCEALYGNTLEFLAKDNNNNLVYRLILGTREIRQEDVPLEY